MPDKVVEYIEQMLKSGRNISEIRTVLLAKYPPKYVARCITEAQHPGYVEREEVREEIKKPLTLIEKLGGILFTPSKVFSRFREEDMIQSFYFYAACIGILFFILFLAFLMGGSIVSRVLNDTTLSGLSGLTFFKLVISFCSYYLAALLMPFAIVAYYYLFLKIAFRMKKGYDECYKAVIYSLIQLIFLGFFIGLVGAILIAFGGAIGSLISGILFFGVIVFNIMTQIHGITKLCDVRKFQAAVVVLLPLVIALCFWIAGFFLLRKLVIIG